MRELIIGRNEAGQRLDKYLKKYMPGAPSGFLYKMLRKKNITVDGHRAEGRELLLENSRVRLYLSDATIEKFRTADTAFSEGHTPLREDIARVFESRVLFMDRDILAFNKPAGMLVQPADTGRSVCINASGKTASSSDLSEFSIAGLLPEYLLAKGIYSAKDFEAFRPAPVNRLDRNTSGIVLCGISLAALQYLSKLFSERALQKYYLAIVCGNMESTGILEGWYARDAKRNEASVTRERGEGRERILTGFETLASGERFSLVRAELITGRTHQIRAHLKSIGHPIAGDPKYGISSENEYLRKSFGIHRQLLHASEVHFPKEADGFGAKYSDLIISAPPPEDLTRIMESLA